MIKYFLIIFSGFQPWAMDLLRYPLKSMFFKFKWTKIIFKIIILNNLLSTKK